MGNGYVFLRLDLHYPTYMVRISYVYDTYMVRIWYVYPTYLSAYYTSKQKQKDLFGLDS